MVAAASTPAIRIEARGSVEAARPACYPFRPCRTPKDLSPVSRSWSSRASDPGRSRACCSPTSGADVMRVDRAQNVERRRSRVAADSTCWTAGGVRSAVDLKSPGGRRGGAASRRPGRRADRGLPPRRDGTARARPGACLARNPRLVYGRMTGWGQDGPARPAPRGTTSTTSRSPARSHAIGRARRAAGAAAQPGRRLRRRRRCCSSSASLAALVERQASGKGQVVDAAMVDGRRR